MARDMKAALNKSVESERNTINDRFEKAEALLGTKAKPKRESTKTKAVKAKPKPAPRVKVIRDSFTLPEPDYELISKVKKECMKAGVEANKSEIIRAGLKILAAMNQGQLRDAIGKIERVKTGRPKQD